MKLIGAGRECDVFDLGDGRVLRRSRLGQDLQPEAEIMRWVRDHGFPVPEVFDAAGGEMVMEKVAGPSLLELLPARPWKLESHASLLAELHRRLHALPAPEWLRMGEVSGPSVLHRDFHPANVMMSPAGPMVIDWSAACRGRAAADVAQSWIVMGTSEIPGARWKRAVAGTFRSLFVKMYLRHFDMDDVRSVLADVADYRRAERSVTDLERRRIDELVASAAGQTRSP